MTCATGQPGVTLDRRSRRRYRVQQPRAYDTNEHTHIAGTKLIVRVALLETTCAMDGKNLVAENTLDLRAQHNRAGNFNGQGHLRLNEERRMNTMAVLKHTHIYCKLGDKGYGGEAMSIVHDIVRLHTCDEPMLVSSTYVTCTLKSSSGHLKLSHILNSSCHTAFF